MAKINWEQLRTYAKESLSTLDQQVREAIHREAFARRQAIEEKRIKKLKRRKRKQRQQASRD